MSRLQPSLRQLALTPRKVPSPYTGIRNISSKRTFPARETRAVYPISAALCPAVELTTPNLHPVKHFPTFSRASTGLQLKEMRAGHISYTLEVTHLIIISKSSLELTVLEAKTQNSCCCSHEPNHMAGDAVGGTMTSLPSHSSPCSGGEALDPNCSSNPRPS